MVTARAAMFVSTGVALIARTIRSVVTLIRRTPAKLDNAPRLTRVFRFLIQRRPAAAVAAMPTIVIISTRTMVAKSVLAARLGGAFRCPILHLPIQWPVIRYRRALVRTV